MTKKIVIFPSNGSSDVKCKKKMEALFIVDEHLAI